MTGSLVSQGIINGLSLAGIYILVGLGLTLVMSIANITQMSHGEIYMIGSYLMYTFVAVLRLNFVLALVLTAVAVAVLGVLIERFAFRPVTGDPDHAMIVSIGLILVFQNIVLVVAGGNAKSFTSSFSGVIKVFGTTLSWQRLVIIIVALVLVIALLVFVKTSRMGQAMLAMSQDRVGAALQGVSVNRMAMLVISLGCVFAAIGGALVAPLFGIIPTMGSFALMKGICVIIIGGLGSITGALIGGFLIGLIDGLLPLFTSSYVASLVSFAAVIVVLLVRPRGIAGRGE